MFCCSHVYHRRLRHSTSVSIRAVHDVVPCNLDEIHHRAGNGLVALSFFLVQQRTFRLFRRNLRTEAWSTRRFAVGHAEPFQNVFGVVLMANRQRFTLSVARHLHANTSDTSPMSVVLNSSISFLLIFSINWISPPTTRRSSTYSVWMMIPSWS